MQYFLTMFFIFEAPPKMENSLKNKHLFKKENRDAFENSPIFLSCPFSGYPLPQFSWSKEGQFLNSKTDPLITTSESGKVLHIKFAKAHHSGVYECVARNEAGESRQKFSVDIMGIV